VRTTGLHTAWVIVAAVVNVNIAAEAAGASPNTLVSAALVSTHVAAASTATLTLAFKDPTFALVGAWALAAIRHKLEVDSAPEPFGQKEITKVAEVAGAYVPHLIGLGAVVLCWRVGKLLGL
jgi:hypothetical protein